MTTATVPDAGTPAVRRFTERLHFLSSEGEDVRAFDLVYGLVGVCQALDRHPVCVADDHETHETATRLATAARLLAEQLEARVEFDRKPRRAIRQEGAR